MTTIDYDIREIAVTVAGSDVVTAGSPGRTAVRAVLTAVDALAVIAALSVAAAVTPILIGGPGPSAAVVAGTVPLWLLLFTREHLYRSRSVVRRVDEVRRLAAASVQATVLAALAVTWFDPTTGLASFLIAPALAVGSVGGTREVVRRWFMRQRQSGRQTRPVVVVGSVEDVMMLESMLADEPILGYVVAAHVGGGDATVVADTLAAAADAGATGVVVVGRDLSIGTRSRLVRAASHAGLHVDVAASLYDVGPERLEVRRLGRIPVVHLRPDRARWRRAVKRAIDVMSASAVAIAILPAVAAIALAIKLDTSGPVMFRQERVGRHGRRFELWKFRTMVQDAESRLEEVRQLNDADGPLFKIHYDPRVTRVGRFLRRTSLDELPQLWNVLRGEMSLVGPRPAIPAEVLSWDPELFDRLRVKPGITGLWQVSGRSDASFESYRRLDLQYVDNSSITTDLAILLKTIPTVLFGRGAY